MFLGGFLIRVFKLELFGMIRLNIGVTLIAALLGIAFLAKCPETNLAGLRVSYPGERYDAFQKLFCQLKVVVCGKYKNVNKTIKKH